MHKAILAVTLVLIASAGLLLYFFHGERQIPSAAYSDKPQDWIGQEGLLRKIDIDEATDGKGYEDVRGLQFREEGIETVFDYDGLYQGQYFKKEFIDSEEKMRMRITSEMSPANGIIEGFIVETFEDGIPVAHIFLDEDWKRQLGDTYIYWGASFGQSRQFHFTASEGGIYADAITDEPERFEKAYKLHRGGIIVGDVTPQKLEQEDTNITIIKLV